MSMYDTQKNYDASSKVKFTNDNLEKFIIDHGAVIEWEKSFICPCRTTTGSPQQNCPVCHGTGMGFEKPVETQMMIQSTVRGMANSDIGLSMPGTSMGTVMEEDEVSFRDRITFSDMSIPASIMFKITTNHITHGLDLKYNVHSIESIYINDGIVRSPKDNEITYDLKNNKVTVDKSLLGKYVSFNLKVSLRFYVIDILKEGRYQYENNPRQGASNRELTKLPRKVLMRREDMFIPAINETEDGKVTDDSFEPKRTIPNTMEGFFE